MKNVHPPSLLGPAEGLGKQPFSQRLSLASFAPEPLIGLNHSINGRVDYSFVSVLPTTRLATSPISAVSFGREFATFDFTALQPVV